MALADSGSQVSCLSEKYYEDNLPVFKNCPVLPIVGTSVVGATGGRPVKLKKQIFVTLGIGELRCKATFLIIPKLTKDCVVGIDVLKPLGGMINLKNNTLTVQDEIMSNTVELYEEDSVENPVSNHHDLRIMEVSEELTLEQVNTKMDSLKEMAQVCKQKYKDLLWKYRRIFTSRPGRISCYKHRLTLINSCPPGARTYPIPLNYEKQADE